MVSVFFCSYGRGAEAHWFTEAVHLVPSLGHWDTVSSSMTFPNPNHVLCMSSVCRDGLTEVFVHVRLGSVLHSWGWLLISLFNTLGLNCLFATLPNTADFCFFLLFSFYLRDIVECLLLLLHFH